MKKEYVVDLIEPPKATSGARKIRRARIFLLAEEGYIETEHRKNLEGRISNRIFAKLLGI